MKWLVTHINDYITAPLVPLVLIICGFYLTARLRFLYITKFRVLIRVLFSKRKNGGGVSPFRAVTVALAGTLGVGNILGVASAIFSGGPGAIFWMWTGALLSMMIKYCEVALAVKYRRIKAEGGYTGGAVYYIANRRIAALFALLCIAASFTLGNMMQMRAVSDTLYSTFGISPLICGIVFAALVWLSICRGFKRLSSLTVVLIPFACAAYLLFSIYVIIENLCLIPSVIARIFKEAFSFRAAAGGASGWGIARAVRYGISRGLVTNESGCGTAPMAHAEADTDCPVEQGFFGIFEVFADTVLLCTASAFVILVSLDSHTGLDGMELAIASYASSFGSAAGYILSAFVVIFAFSTMIGWSHYGSVSLSFLTDSRKTKRLYLLLYSLSAIPAVYLSGSFIWSLTDLVLGAMTLINMLWVIKRAGEVGNMTESYFITS